MIRLDWHVLDFRTRCRRQKALSCNFLTAAPQAPAPSDPLPGGGCYGNQVAEWHARKHGGAKRRVQCKIHIGKGDQTFEVRAIEVTGSNVGDALMLPDLLSQVPLDQEI
ncbi:MAG: hypothetical protein COB16_07710 [Rhodobacteraceae bacterium]|nr:MAG: hypothetical protein COB16_07710 [Paracoccaceae bacterium]